MPHTNRLLNPPTDTSIPLASSHYDKISKAEWTALDPSSSEYECNPSVIRIAAAKHHLVYLVHTRHLGLLFSTTAISNFGPTNMASDSLQLYHDATFACEPSDSSSVAGVLAFLDGTPIYWHVSNVSYVTRSSTESELWGADDASAFLELTRLRRAAAATLSPTLAARLAEPCCTFTDNPALRDMLWHAMLR